jgi:hypothetical protein
VGWANADVLYTVHTYFWSNRPTGWWLIHCLGWHIQWMGKTYQITLSGSWNAAKKLSATAVHKRSPIQVLTKHNVA